MEIEVTIAALGKNAEWTPVMTLPAFVDKVVVILNCLLLIFVRALPTSDQTNKLPYLRINYWLL